MRNRRNSGVASQPWLASAFPRSLADSPEMATDWDARIEAFWADASGADDEATLTAMEALVSERTDNDAAAVYEWASVHDFLGRESDAIPLYRRALDLGLDDARRPQALSNWRAPFETSASRTKQFGQLNRWMPVTLWGTRPRHSWRWPCLTRAGRVTPLTSL